MYSHDFCLREGNKDLRTSPAFATMIPPARPYRCSAVGYGKIPLSPVLLSPQLNAKQGIQFSGIKYTHNIVQPPSLPISRIFIIPNRNSVKQQLPIPPYPQPLAFCLYELRKKKKKGKVTGEERQTVYKIPTW